MRVGEGTLEVVRPVVGSVVQAERNWIEALANMLRNNSGLKAYGMANNVDGLQGHDGVWWGLCSLIEIHG